MAHGVVPTYIPNPPNILKIELKFIKHIPPA